MAGLQNDYLIMPILELIRSEIRKTQVATTGQQGDPFEGTPAVALYRRHPMDTERVTGVVMQYDSGYRVEIILGLGSDDPIDFPPSVSPGDAEWEFYALWRLNQVTITSFTPDDQPLVTYSIVLNYDDRGLLTGTTVDRI